MKFQIISIFLKLQFRHRGLYLFTIFVMSLLTLSILSFPFNNPIQYAIEYQKDDLYATIDKSSSLSSFSLLDQWLQSKFDQLDFVFNYTFAYFTSIILAYNGNFVNSEGLFVIHFDENIIVPELIVPMVWYRDFDNVSVITDEGVFNKINLKAIERSENEALGYDEKFDGVLTLPQSYQKNYSSYYLGIELSKNRYKGLDPEIIGLKLESNINQIQEDLQKNWPDIQLEKPVIETQGFIEDQFSILLLQNIIVLLLILGSLVILLYYIQNWIYRKELNNYLILQHRGVSDETQFYYIPAMFVLLNVLLNFVITVVISLILKKTFSLSSLLPISITGFTAIIASYNNVEAIIQMEPVDATDIKLDPGYLEYTFFILTIISALVNLYLNFPLIQNIELLLVLIVYVSIGLLFAVILYFVANRFRIKIRDRLDVKNKLSMPQTISRYIHSILIRKLKKNFRIAILIGFVLLFSSSHLYVTNQIDQQNQNIAGTEIWGNYPDYSEISQISSSNIEGKIDFFIPSTLNKLGVSLSGIILTDIDIVSYRPSLQRMENKIAFPSLWMSEDLKRDFTLEILRTDGFPMSIGVGDEIINFNGKISGFYSIHTLLPTTPQFLFFVPESYLDNYNQSANLIYRNTSEDITEDLQVIESKLDQPIIWEQKPRDNPIVNALKESSGSLILTKPVIIYLIFGMTLILLGFVQPTLLLKTEQQIIRIRGATAKSQLLATINNQLILFPLYLVVTIIGSISTVMLIQLFNLLPLISLSINFIEIVLFCFLSVFWLFFGEILGWIVMLRNPLDVS